MYVRYSLKCIGIDNFKGKTFLNEHIAQQILLKLFRSLFSKRHSELNPPGQKHNIRNK